MSKLRRRTRHMIYAALAGAAVMGMAFAGYAVFSSMQHHARENRIRDEYREQIAKLEQARLEEEKRLSSSWVLSRDIAAGEVIQQKDLVQVKLPPGAAPVNLVQGNEQGGVKIAKIELRKGTALTDAMVYEKEPLRSDLRNRELQVVTLPSNLREHEVIDVRIQFSTGQDYIILSKKRIDKLTSPIIWITMTEQEILSFSSAMVDAYLHDAKLYAVTYVEPEMQDQAIPNYPVNKEVLKLIDSDPNIVTKAEQKLSEAVRVSLEKDLSKMPSRMNDSQSFTDAVTVPTYDNGNTFMGQTSVPMDAAEPLFSDLKQTGDSSGEKDENAAGDGIQPLAGQTSDSFSLGDAQTNALLEQSKKDNKAGETVETERAGHP